MEEVDNLIETYLKEKSEEAIKRGNKFQGFLGKDIEYFSKEQLIMLLNILTDEKELIRYDLSETSKRLFLHRHNYV